jgi:hypothetical protein
VRFHSINPCNEEFKLTVLWRKYRAFLKAKDHGPIESWRKIFFYEYVAAKLTMERVYVLTIYILQGSYHNGCRYCFALAAANLARKDKDVQ